MAHSATMDKSQDAVRGDASRARRRARCGRQAEAWGRAAEAAVAAWYLDRGARFVAERVRTKAGEIDLVFELDAQMIFVEVRARRTLAAALESAAPEKLRRVGAAAEAFLAGRGTLDVSARIDVAAVDRRGGLEVVENASL